MNAKLVLATGLLIALCVDIAVKSNSIKSTLLDASRAGTGAFDSAVDLNVSCSDHRHEVAKAAMRRAALYNYHAPEPRSPQERQEASEFCGPAPLYTKYFEQPPVGRKKYRSVNDEDKTIYTHFIEPFQDRLVQPPTYVELGAFNGLEESNSLFFDKCLGWDGLLVEANPHQAVFPGLVNNRRHAHRFHMAASCDDDGTKNMTMPFYATAWTNSAQGNTSNAYEGKRQSVDVPCGSLTHLLLDLFPGGHVTFFSLDVEGAEPNVLRQLDFGRLFIELMIVENFNVFCAREPADCQSRNEFRKIMKDAGYILYNKIVAKSDLFVHPKSQFLQAKILAGKTAVDRQ